MRRGECQPTGRQGFEKAETERETEGKREREGEKTKSKNNSRVRDVAAELQGEDKSIHSHTHHSYAPAT